MQVEPEELYFPPKGMVIRAGVIPYKFHQGEIYYLIGRDIRNFYTDMGGGCKRSRNERPIDCLIREIKEETDSMTSERVISAFYTNKIEVWRETRPTFADFGYPFVQKHPGPIHRYFVLLEVDAPGGLTVKEEVLEYKWMSQDEVAKLDKTKINQACRDFFSKKVK